MGCDKRIIDIDAEIAKLRTDIDRASDKSTEEIVTKQQQVDALIAARYARLIEIDQHRPAPE
jgi:hypothetical protein